MTSNTSLYGSTTTNGNVGSTNFTTLYSGSGTSIKPTTGYGNANVERFLNAGTDGANVIANIIANGTITSAGNITAPWFIGNVVGNISGNIVVPGSNTAVLYNNNGNAGASDALKFNFSSNVLTANGNIVANYFIGNGSGLSSLTGANVTGQVGYAAVANSVAVANVVGIGNIATINLNGNGSQVLLGNGAWGNGGGGNASNANYANFAGNVTVSAQPNITTVGNLLYANVIDSSNTTGVIRQFAPNSVVIPSNFTNNASYDLATVYWPNASTGMPVSSVIRSRGDATTPTTAVSGDRITQNRHLAYNGNTNVLAVSETTSVSGTVNSNSNAAYTGGQWVVSTGNPTGDIGNSNAVSGLNVLTFSNSGALSITPGTAPNTSAGQSTTSLLITNYGRDTTNLVQAGGLNFQRARGNRDSVQSVQAGDQIGRSVFIGYSNGAYQSTNSAQWRTIVDSSYVANDVIIPLSHQFQTVANVGNVATFFTTSFYSNGLAQFPGAVNTSGDLFVGSYSNLTVSGNSILNSNSNVFIAGGSAGDALITNGSGNLSWSNIVGNANTANYANFAGDVVNSTQSNITSLGNLVDLRISNSNIHLGSNAGVTTQSANSIAIGTNAGLTNQGNGITNARSIAIGFNAANTNQGDSAVAIGRGAGQNVQANHSVALGWSAAGNNQGSNSIAIGTVAGNTFQGNYAVAIGVGAGRTNQANNSIVLNASGSNLDQTIANTFTVKPVRANLTGNVLFYDTTSGEISYDVISNISNVSTANYANFAGTLINGNSNISIVANANVNMSISGNANVVQFDGNGSIWSNPLAGGYNNWLRINNYGTVANGASASRISSFRYRGNAAANLSVEPNDSTIDIITLGYNGSILQTSSLARIRANVDSSYVANGANIPLGWQIVVNDTNGGINNQAKTHNFYSNGNVAFANSMTAVGNIQGANVRATSLLRGLGNSQLGDSTSLSATTHTLWGSTTMIGDVGINGNATTGASLTLGYGNVNMVIRDGNLNVQNANGNGGYLTGTFVRSYDSLEIRALGQPANVAMYSANGAVTATGTVTANNFVGNLTGNTNIANLKLTKFQETVVSGGTVSGTLTPNSSAGTIYNYTLNGNITINSLGNAVAGTSMTLILTQDGTGNRVLSSTMKFASGLNTLSTAASATDIMSVFYDGSTYYATLSRGFV